ncbi:MAG: pyruvate kinase [Aerococcaceae bacterium]|nr:pyruvate kinase [Aerococcaceae bacterium]
MKKTKIVATLGPAVEIRDGKKFGEDGYWAGSLDVEASAQKIAQLIKAGANVFRFNFSHGDHAEQGARMATVRRAEEIAGQKVAFLLDTKGPEIRTELFEGEAKEYAYTTGETLRVTTKQGVKSTKEVIALSVAGALDIYDDVEVGKQILVDDGKLGLTVVAKDDATREFEVRVENDGVIAKQKGVNIPYTKIPFPALAERDNADIRFGLEQGLNFIAISFVRTAKDVEAVRAICEETGNGHVQLIAKIENQQGIDNIEEIIAAADGIMVARGDLGVEIPTEEVPIMQKYIIQKCNEAAKPVITATQMLDSMQKNPRPTRAEAGDVANAIFDGTDAVMLSGETANGEYPVEAVTTMANICVRTEQAIAQAKSGKKVKFAETDLTEAIGQAVAQTASNLNIGTIVAATSSGRTARMISKFRPNSHIVAATFDDQTARSLAITWGVLPYVVEKPASTDAMLESAVELAKAKGFAEAGEAIIITAGVPVGQVGTTNLMKIEKIG